MKIYDKTTQTYKELVLKPGGDTLPIGATLSFSGDIIPNGWLLCDGSAFSASEYPELFDLIGVTYGWDEDRNPLLPDMRGRVVVGKKAATSVNDTEFNALGKTGGEKEHTLTIDEMPSHTHEIKKASSVGGDGSGLAYSSTETTNSAGILNTGGSQPHNNLQPYIVTNYIIKAKMTVAIEGEIIQENGTPSASNVYSASAVDNKLKTNIIIGQEYKTGRIIGNKEEYGKIINFGSLPNATEKIVSTNLKTIEVTLTRVDGIAYTSTGEADYALTLPDINPVDATQATRLTLDTSIADGNRVWNVKIRTGVDRSNYIAYINIYYTKN